MKNKPSSQAKKVSKKLILGENSEKQTLISGEKGEKLILISGEKGEKINIDLR